MDDVSEIVSDRAKITADGLNLGGRPPERRNAVRNAHHVPHTDEEPMYVRFDRAHLWNFAVWNLG